MADEARRIDVHPILGEIEKGKQVAFTYDGQTLYGYEGEPVAAALKAAGVMVHRYTKRQHTERHFLCHRPLYRLRHGC